MEYFVADSYKGYELIGSPFDKGGKLYSEAKCKCDRCHKGIYVARVENNQIVPHPAYGGVCLKCGGSGYLTKTIRLYTETEYNRMQKANAAARARKEASREKEMRENYAQKKADWLESHGFSAEGVTYIVTGDSYSIKEQLKSDGFKYDTVLKWHKSSAEGYENQTIELNIDEVIEFSAWGEGHYKLGAKDIIEKKIAAAQPKVNSNWVGEISSKYEAGLVQLIRKSGFETAYGFSYVYTFQDQDENILTWFTAKDLGLDINDQVYLKGTVKSHDEYKSVKNTILTRCKIEEVG